MELTQYDIFAYQILHYLVVKQNYQIVRVQQHQDDLWLMNAKQTNYPVIRISSKPNAGSLADSEYIRNVHRMILNLMHREGPIMIFNTNPESTPIDNEVMMQIRITPQEISNKDITKTFKELNQILHDVDDYQNELAELSKEVEEAQLKRQTDFMKKVKARHLPKLTIGIMSLCIVYSLLALSIILVVKDATVAAVVSGAFYKMNIVAAHEYWRLLTAGFLQVEPIALLMNMYALYLVGKHCERVFTKVQFICILLVSILVGNACMLIAGSNQLADGIGGGIFGLFGAYGILLLVHQSLRNPIVKISLFSIILRLILVTLFSTVSIYSLLISLVCGSLLGLLFDSYSHWPQIKKHVKIAGILALFVIGFLSVMSKQVEPLDKEFDQKIVAVYHHTNMNWYGNYLQRSYNKQYRME